DAIELKPRRVAERFELGGCFFEFHGNKLYGTFRIVNPNFEKYGNTKPRHRQRCLRSTAG
ncbi:hypothetical protein, partial [Mesorhizobium sp. M7A.F.Ca.CA.002.05.1.1]|uniref:hypothetical protein n=1 Tax=Mesorhizobium sp. M7A.F.Ca.CA.002.05.1.1 TaxID=2496704 RepID=UPI0019D2846D